MDYLSTFASDLFQGIDYDLAIDKAVSDNEEIVIDLNTSQLKQGLRADGVSTGEYKNIAYKGTLK
ncbi:hypothetical protein, partial [Bacillus cereus group sp. BC325]|uniref:hypothetical protein n=1 Tax=Bacillus cereus group sp. BC325 TaxID=3445311 RepID=UPI003F1F8DB9